jgi:hypothetical protein
VPDRLPSRLGHILAFCVAVEQKRGSDGTLALSPVMVEVAPALFHDPSAKRRGTCRCVEREAPSII